MRGMKHYMPSYVEKHASLNEVLGGVDSMFEENLSGEILSYSEIPMNKVKELDMASRVKVSKIKNTVDLIPSLQPDVAPPEAQATKSVREIYDRPKTHPDRKLIKDTMYSITRPIPRAEWQRLRDARLVQNMSYEQYLDQLTENGTPVGYNSKHLYDNLESQSGLYEGRMRPAIVIQKERNPSETIFPGIFLPQ